MKVGDLVKRKSGGTDERLFLVVKVEENWHGLKKHKCVRLHPDPNDPDFDHTDWGNYYFVRDFEVISESR